MNLLVLSPALMASVADAVGLVPRLITVGPEAGNGAVNPAVLYDPAHEAFWDVLLRGRMVDLDVAETWPPVADEEE